MSAAASTSAQPAQQPQQSPEDQALGLFARSALDLFDMWPALRLAISHGWGGDGGQGKTHLAEDVVDLFYSTATSGQGGEGSASASGSSSTHEGGIPIPPMDEIEQTLLYVIGNEFDVDLEDGSEHTVARDLVNLWRECLQRVRAGEEGIAKEGPLAEKFRIAAEKARVQDGQQRFEAQRQGGDEDEGETSSEGEYETEDDEDEEMGAIEREAPPPRERQEPVVDEDGFELVQTKKKGGRR
ncbi:Pre-rRNA-processing protein TSR2 [Rhodotorula toruloides]|nr:Pre-rRNA-processing protein TSR2 [Rhodotorula toruloides]